MSSVSIGFRVTPDKFFYAVVEQEAGNFEPVSAETIKFPPAFDDPKKLKFARDTVYDLLREHHAQFGGVKLTENNARGLSAFRLNTEGVIQEAFASGSLTSYFFGTIPELTGAFGYKDRKLMKNLIDGMADFDHFDLKAYKKEHREGFLVGIAAILKHGNQG